MSDKKINRAIIKYKHENPEEEGTFFGSFTLSKKEDKKDWKFLKEHIQKDDGLKVRYGYPKKKMTNSKICKIMIKFMCDLYKDKEKVVEKQIKDLKRSLIVDKISLLEK